MFFGKKKIEIPVEAIETFEQRKRELIARRKKIYDEAMQHSGDPAYSWYISGCKNYLEAAANAEDMRDLILAERMSSPSYRLPRSRH